MSSWMESVRCGGSPASFAAGAASAVYLNIGMTTLQVQVPDELEEAFYATLPQVLVAEDEDDEDDED